VLNLAPAAVRPALIAHREAVKFLVTGAACFALTVVINYVLKLTILHSWPVTALTIATIVSLIVSYVLNRQWSFRTRGGRRQHHEVALFFLVSAVGVALNVIPLYVSRYGLDIRVPDVSRSAQEIADFVSGNILGTLIALVFRLWAMKRFVFPDAGARSRRRVEARPLLPSIPATDAKSREPVSSR
jgi:putative flippase GtrA